MSQPLPPPRQVPVVPRPRHGELSASYLARVARANRTEFRSFAGLLGRLPSGLPRNPGHLTFTIVTLNEAAFARLLAYTGHDAGRLIRAVPSLAPATFTRPGEPPALRVATLREQMLDCPQCLLRRGGAFIDTRLFPDLARHYLREDWRKKGSPFWESSLADRWYQRAEAIASATTSWLPSWAMHPECAALAAVFASPYWAERAVPVPNRRHRLFYQHMLAVLGVDNWTRRTASIRGFGSLPHDIREQAGWGRILSDPEWGTLPPPGTPRKIPFIDITNAYECPAA